MVGQKSNLIPFGFEIYRELTTTLSIALNVQDMDVLLSPYNIAYYNMSSNVPFHLIMFLNKLL